MDNRSERFTDIVKLLRNRKRVTTKEHKLIYSEDFNDPNSGCHDSAKVKHTLIEYIYTNPQFNRMFAKLEDGRVVDYDLPFMRIIWNEFEEYIPPKPPKKKLTLEEIEQKLGYEIELIKQ